MLQFPPASLPWLLRHELRLWWRELRGKWFIFTLAVIFGLLTVAASLIWLLAVQSGEFQPLTIPDPLPLVALQIAGGIWLFCLFYSVIQAMGLSLTALFDRGDLDLLVSSPLPSKIIFASRLLSVAIEVFLGFLSILILAILGLLLLGFFRLLGAILVLFCLCLWATSLSMLLSLWLVRWLGPRKARTVAQVLTTLFAALFFLGLQLPNLVNNTATSDRWQFVSNWFEPGQILGVESWLWFPVRAVFLEVPSTIALLITTGAIAWITIEILHRWFFIGIQQPLTVKRSPQSTTAPVRFQKGFWRIFLLKEWRVIGRSPYLLSQVLISTVFLLPLLFIVLQGRSTSAAVSLATVVTTALPVAGASLTASLGVICISAEEAPALLKTAPVEGSTLRSLKLLAVVLPVWVLMSPLFLVLILRGDRWLPGFGVFLLATSCSALLRLWNARPIALSGLMSKQRQNANQDTILLFLESGLFFVWIFLGLQISQGGAWIVQSLLGVGLVMAIAYWRSRALGSSLGF